MMIQPLLSFVVIWTGKPDEPSPGSFAVMPECCRSPTNRLMR
jgi:hypothetical protein